MRAKRAVGGAFAAEQPDSGAFDHQTEPELRRAVELAMRGRGRLTLPAVAALVGRDTFMGRGAVGHALFAIASAGKLKVTPAPRGTPERDKIKFITYELT